MILYLITNEITNKKVVFIFLFRGQALKMLKIKACLLVLGFFFVVVFLTNARVLEMVVYRKWSRPDLPTVFYKNMEGLEKLSVCLDSGISFHMYCAVCQTFLA